MTENIYITKTEFPDTFQALDEVQKKLPYKVSARQLVATLIKEAAQYRLNDTNSAEPVLQN